MRDPELVLLIDRSVKLFDGFSIGANDLAQLMLGGDRDSAMVGFDFDERDPGVLEMLKLAVDGARRNGRHSGTCRQAPSDYPEIAEYLYVSASTRSAFRPIPCCAPPLLSLALD